LQDGYHRLEALKQLGVDKVSVVVKNTGESKGVIPEVGGKKYFNGVPISKEVDGYINEVSKYKNSAEFQRAWYDKKFERPKELKNISPAVFFNKIKELEKTYIPSGKFTELKKGLYEYSSTPYPQSPSIPEVKTTPQKEIVTKTKTEPTTKKKKVLGKQASRVFERLKAENPQLGDNVTYDTINLKKQAKKAVSMLKKDKQKLFNIAMGYETSKTLTSTSANIAMAEKALQDGNNKLYERLVKNRSLAQTRRGQEIVSEKGSVTDNSTSRYVKELINSRLEDMGKKYLGDLETAVTKKSNKERAIKVIDEKVIKLENEIKNSKISVKNALLLLDKLTCL